MKILHFLPWYSPYTKGGTEIFLLNLATSQLEHEHQVQIICPNIKEDIEIDYIGNIRITYFPFPYGFIHKDFLSGNNEHPTCDTFAQLVKAIDPNVIHLHGIAPHFLPYFEKLQKISNCKKVFTAHLVSTVCLNQTLINHKGESCDGKVNFITCASCITSNKTRSPVKYLLNKLTIPINNYFYNEHGQIGLTYYFSSQNDVISKINLLKFLRNNVCIDVLNSWFYDVFKVNGFDDKRLTYFENPLFISSNFIASVGPPKQKGKKHFLFIGRVCVEKGIELLIETIKLLDNYKTTFTLTIVGKHFDDVLIKELHALINQGFEINLVGEVKNDALVHFLNQSDFLLVPSKSEMSPLVIQEALQNNLPVVSTDIPAARTVLKNGVNGFLFKSNDKIEFHKTLEHIMSGDNVLKTMYNGGSDINFERYSYYDKVYRSVC